MCTPRCSDSSTVVALVGAVATMAVVSAAASVVASAATLAAAVISYVLTVVVTLAATTSIAAALYASTRLAVAIASTQPESTGAEVVAEIGPGAVAALPVGDTTTLVIPTTAVEVPR